MAWTVEVWGIDAAGNDVVLVSMPLQRGALAVAQHYAPARPMNVTCIRLVHNRMLDRERDDGRRMAAELRRIYPG